ncbi:hypothetical protein [Staphylococcus caledonicus]|uniref:hypothetical protein n=1 Tax=Staphylococcus caledonicus TaxID=2741333 RepID=UPI0018E4052E|nr:hypothetical protein [Staphylococcus caledonicus]MBI5973934.1 hypothetical protein [Staphylococcus caledonicus]
MKLKNINNYTHQELQDVVTQVKAELQLNEFLEEAVIILANFQEEEEEGQKYYEIYHSEIRIDEDTTVQEALEQQIETERLVREYKTQRGLIQAFINENEIKGEYYKIHTRI